MDLCESCRFWRAYDGPPHTDESPGDCMRYPPTVHIMTFPDGDFRDVEYVRPEVEASDWCGEHRRNDE